MIVYIKHPVFLLFLFCIMPNGGCDYRKTYHSQEVASDDFNHDDCPYQTKTDWILDREHWLDYPIGRDTLFFCAKGRYQVVYDRLKDCSGDIVGQTLMTNLSSFWETPDTVYFLSEDQFGILEGDCQFYSYCLLSLPEEYQWRVEAMSHAIVKFQKAEALALCLDSRQRRRAKMPSPRNAEGISVIPLSYKPLSLAEQEEVIKRRIVDMELQEKDAQTD